MSFLHEEAENTPADDEHAAAEGTPSPMRFRAIIPVIRAAGLVSWSVVFLVIYLVASFAVAAVEPGIRTFADGAWLMFQVATTIGLGDFTCTTLIGRICSIVVSVYSVFFLALITGACVNYCTERMRFRRDRSVAQFIDQLEHLDELSREELAEISKKVRRL